MKWRFRRGLVDFRDFAYYMVGVSGIILSLLMLCMWIKTLLGECLVNLLNGVPISSTNLIFWVLGTLYFAGCTVFLVPMGNWMLEKFCLTPQGIQIKSFFGKRTVYWNSIEKTMVYKVLFGNNNDGPRYIVVFLDWEKRPKRLNYDSFFFKRKFAIIIRATEDNIKEYESYWGKPIEIGYQKANLY